MLHLKLTFGISIYSFLDNETAYLMVTNKVRFLQVALGADMDTRILNVAVANMSNIVSVDVDMATDTLYWADATRNKIFSGFRNGTSVREVSVLPQIQNQVCTFDLCLTLETSICAVLHKAMKFALSTSEAMICFSLSLFHPVTQSSSC